MFSCMARPSSEGLSSGGGYNPTRPHRLIAGKSGLQRKIGSCHQKMQERAGQWTLQMSPLASEAESREGTGEAASEPPFCEIWLRDREVSGLR